MNQRVALLRDQRLAGIRIIARVETAKQAAAIDRMVHHSVILEIDVPSYRTDQARERSATSQDGEEEAKKENGRNHRKE